jgi:hypothetical protein
MVTQLLFGEHFELLDSKGNWQLIRITYDGYECWIDKKQFLPLKDIKGISDAATAVTTDLVQLAEDEQGTMISILLGSSLPKFKDKTFSLGKHPYIFEGEISFPFEKKKIQHQEKDIERTSRWYLNTPYLWGGRSPFGIDCSGFTQLVFKLNGIKLKRDAWQQAEQGTALSFVEEALTGDLAYFDNEDGKIVHVGIVLNQLSQPVNQSTNFQIIHASGKVRIDKLDHHGIYNEELKKYSHRLRVVKRFIS